MASSDSVDLVQIIVPRSSDMKTDEAHLEALISPLFNARLLHMKMMMESMKRAIENDDITTIGRGSLMRIH